MLPFPHGLDLFPLRSPPGARRDTGGGDENTIYVLGINLHVSHDGGAEFRPVDGPDHVDHHGLWIDPDDPDVIYDCNDGGIDLSGDAGRTWRHAAIPATHLWNLTLDMASPFRAYGAVQDHVSYRGVVDAGKTREALEPQPFERTPGGERTIHAVDPSNPDIVFTGSPLRRFDLSNGGRVSTDISPAMQTTDPPLRSIPLVPIVLAPQDSKTVYAGFQYLFRSRDRGDHWERISPDLTANDKAARTRPPFARQAIADIAVSPIRRGLVFVGTDDGRLHVTRDDGRTWADVTGSLPPNGRGVGVSSIATSAFAEGTAYVTQRGSDQVWSENDFAPHVSKSTDYGKTFVSLASNLPTGNVRVVREDPTDPRILYLGTGTGAYVSMNGGERWEVLGGNLPTVAVTGVQVHPREHMIVISTYGRGIWAMDALKVRAIHPSAAQSTTSK